MAVEVLVTFGLARSIEEQARSIESQAECVLLQNSNSALAYLKCLGFYVFAQVYKANPSHVLEVVHITVCVNLL